MTLRRMLQRQAAEIGSIMVTSYAKAAPLPTLEDLDMEAYRPTSYSTLNAAENCAHKHCHKNLVAGRNCHIIYGSYVRT